MTTWSLYVVAVPEQQIDLPGYVRRAAGDRIPLDLRAPVVIGRGAVADGSLPATCVGSHRPYRLEAG